MTRELLSFTMVTEAQQACYYKAHMDMHMVHMEPSITIKSSLLEMLRLMIQ